MAAESESNAALRALIVEDSAFDAGVLANALQSGGYRPDWICVDTLPDFEDALANGGPWDVILSDYNLPTFKAPEALSALQQTGKDIPFVIISGGIGEDVAAAAMKAGASDYLMKGQLTRLVPMVEREIREAESRRAARTAERRRREIELRYRLLWENSTDAVVLFDSGYRVRMANPAAATVFGYSEDELVGESIDSLFQPHGEEYAQGPGPTVPRLGESKKKSVIESIAFRRDGSSVFVEFTFTELSLDGEAHGALFVRDVTSRKTAESELKRAAEQFEVAHEVQQRLFPKSAPTTPGFDIAGASRPAEQTGGDHFDYLPIADGSLGVVVADVTGHGVGPAMLMAETRAYLRIVARNREDLGEILTRTNKALEGDLDFERYITALMVKLDPEKRLLQFVNAGHPNGYILGPDGAVKNALSRCGPPLGIRPDVPYTSSEWLALETGDTALLVTDGIEETVGDGDRFFEESGVLEAARSALPGSARAVVDAILGAAERFSVAQSDDWTLVVIRCTD